MFGRYICWSLCWSNNDVKQAKPYRGEKSVTVANTEYLFYEQLLPQSIDNNNDAKAGVPTDGSARWTDADNDQMTAGTPVWMCQVLTQRPVRWKWMKILSKHWNKMHTLETIQTVASYKQNVLRYYQLFDRKSKTVVLMHLCICTI